jgi:hypothetical protein
MQSKRHQYFQSLLAEMNQRVADAQDIALRAQDGAVQLRAANLLPELLEAKARIERLIRLETARVARLN